MKKILFYLLSRFRLVFVYPFIWMISASFAPENQIGSLTFLPSGFTLSSYNQMFEKIPIDVRS